MKKVTFVLVAVLFTILPFNISAACSDAEKAELKALADELTIVANHLGNNKYSFTVSNISEKLYIVDSLGDIFDNIDGIDTVTRDPSNGRSGAFGGSTYRFDIYGSSVCKDEYITHKLLKVKAYNKMSTMELCNEEKYKNFNYCSEFLDSAIDENTFYGALAQFNTTYDKKNNTEEVVDDEKNTTEENVSFVDKYFNIIIATVLFITFATIITIIIMKISKRGKNEENN